MLVDWLFKNRSQEIKQITHNDKERIISQFKEWSPHILAIPEVQATITFDEIIAFFKSDHPPNPTVKKGAIICQNHDEGNLLGQVFLDQKNQIICRQDGTPYGRQLVTKNLDSKLKTTLGDRELISFELKTQNWSSDQFNNEDIFSQFDELLSNLLRWPEVVPMMTYEDAVKYFVGDRPGDPRIKKGAILRKHHIQGNHIIQIFLDQNNEPVCDHNSQPYGRQLVVKKLDEELQEYFGNTDLIIVE